MKRLKVRTILYKLFLCVLRIHGDYRGNLRSILGYSPYIRRSPVLQVAVNVQELFRFMIAKRPSKKLVRNINKLKGSKRGKTALVLGNGPSLAKLNMAAVNADAPDIWVVNDFYKYTALRNLRVSHYVLSDIEHLDLQSHTANEKFKRIAEFTKEKGATLVLPNWFEKYLDSLGNFLTYYFDDRELTAWSKNINPTKPRGYISLTLYKALGYALYLGYDQIFILGMDNTQFMGHKSDSANRMLVEGNYAYNETVANENDYSSHFLDGMAGAFTTYAHAFGDIMKFKGPVLNLDCESLTMAFPKISNHRWVK